MKNFILQNENAVYFECKFSCDNVIFLNLNEEKYFITDARYTTEAKQYAKEFLELPTVQSIETYGIAFFNKQCFIISKKIM